MTRTASHFAVALIVLIGGSADGAPAQQPLVADAGFARQVLAPCQTDLHWINQISGWQVRWSTALESQPIDTEERRTAFLETWGTAPAALAEATQALRGGLRADRGAPALVVHRVLDQIDSLVGNASAESVLLSPARRSDHPEFSRAWQDLAETRLEPAIRAYRDFLRQEYLPGASGELGLGRFPGGARCYEEVIANWTTLEIEVDEIERRGRRQLAELERELVALASPDLGTRPREILANLRTGELPDPFESRDDVVQHAEAAVERARHVLPRWFGTPGNTRIEVVRMPPNLERSFPAGLYRQPAGPDDTARYIVNTSRPQDRRLLSEVITFHETIPGHHTSFAVPVAANSTTGGRFNSGFAEGWAIYAERVADEMGLYSSTTDRIGLVAKHLWATSRLVVEPGIHIHGWTRDEAIEFMLDHTALPLEEIELEVDRYVGLPGQSLAYMLGYLELRRIRREAEQKLGDRFDIREFHDVILRPGIRPLAKVADDVSRWVESVRQR